VRIQGDKLKKQLAARGMSPAQLGEVLSGDARLNLSKQDAARGITNWCEDRDHPRCKALAIRKMADALGVRPVDICKFTSVQFGHRGSPRKARLLVDLIRGKNVLEAQNLLTFTTKRAAVNIKRVLMAAVSEAEQAEADTTRLVVTESRVDAGPVMKRFQPKDRGRAHAIIKPFSHITISVEETSAKA
jgi:large subunit ribosomal protein L22